MVGAIATVELMMPLYYPDFDLSVAVAVGLYSLGFAAPAALFVGLPGHLLLAWRQRTSLWPYLVVGAIAGIAPGVLVSVASMLELERDAWSWSEFPYSAWGRLGVPARVVGATIFWYFVVRRDQR